MQKKILRILVGGLLFTILCFLIFLVYPEVNKMLNVFEKKESLMFTDTGSIIITDKNFAATYDEIYTNRDKYYGRSVTLSGYVLIEEGIAETIILLGRDMMWCCEEDQYYIAFMLIGTEKFQPANDEMYHISGVIEKSLYSPPETNEPYFVPAIRVKKFEPLSFIERQVFPF